MNSHLQTDLPLLCQKIKDLTRQKWREILLVGVIALCGGLLIWLAALGQYIRPFQDDFYYYPPQSFKEMGDLLNERFHWTGRFSTTTAHLAIGWSQFHWIVPLISFTVMTTGIVALARVFLSNFSTVSAGAVTKLSLLLGLVLTLILFLVTPSPYSSIFWLSGAPIHFWSYGFVLLYIAYVVKHLFAKKRSLRWFDYVIFSAAPAVIGMFGEIAMLTLFALTIVVATGACLYKSRKLLVIAIANLVGVGVAFYELFFSLGAIIRRGAENAAPINEVVAHAPYVIAKNIYALLTSLMNNRILLVMALLVALIVGMVFMKPIKNVRTMWLKLIGISILLFGLVCINFVAVYSSVRFNIAWSRTQAFSVIVLLSVIMTYGVVVGALLQTHLHARHVKKVVYGFVGVITLIIVANAGFLPYIHDFASSIQNRAIEYDKREVYINTIKNENNATIVCPIELPSTYLWGTQETFDLVDDPLHALNQGAKRYYRLPCDVSGT